jgi:hypothetical protein
MWPIWAGQGGGAATPGRPSSSELRSLVAPLKGKGESKLSLQRVLG